MVMEKGIYTKTLNKLINGNIGAFTVLEELLETTKDDTLPVILNYFTKKKLRGSQLWLEYKNNCNLDIDILKEHALKGDI